MTELANSPMTNYDLNKSPRREFIKKCKSQKGLIALAAIFVVYITIFNYIPIWGWLMAFQDYRPRRGVLGSDWVGLKHFERLVSEDGFKRALRNTLGISFLNMIFGYLSAITLAVFLNEVKNMKFKRTVQTISYLPHFVSWVVAASIVMWTLSIENGIVNIILTRVGLISQPISFLGEPRYFWLIIAISNVWKSVGWNAIIYLAAMTGIDPTLYEAASIDGAGRLKRIFNITLPGIMPTVRILLIMQCGWILNAGFEQILLLQSPVTYRVSDVLDTYTLRYGMAMGRYSFATAAGIFKSVVSIALLFTANKVAKKFSGEGLM
jgi:putative aldouronate transport system permease protein